MDNLKLHHIGVATKNIEKEFEVFKKLGYKQSSEVFIDEIQGIRGMFIEARGQPCLELLENLSSDGPLTSFLQKRTKFYHFAYETVDIERSVSMLLVEGGIVVKPMVAAVYFKRVCFVMMKNMMLVELVER